MSARCHVPWCIVVPLEGDGLCQIHRQYPVLPRETAEAWRLRVGRETRAAARRAKQYAAAEAAFDAEKPTP